MKSKLPMAVKWRMRVHTRCFAFIAILLLYSIDGRADKVEKGPFPAYPDGLEAFRADTGVTHPFNPHNSPLVGECVWFVRAVRPDALPGTTPSFNAYEMWQNAKSAKPAWHVGQTPKPGAVMVIGTSRVPETGHVALVVSVNGDGTIDVWDSNWATPLDREVRKRRLTNPTDGLLGYIYARDSDTPPILSSPLKRLRNSSEVHYLQNDRRYPIPSDAVLATMENAGMSGWNRSFIATVESLPGTLGPDFVGTGGTGSNGLLIRQDKGDGRVFLVQNGWRRHIADPAALSWNGSNWDKDVIDVAPALMSAPFSHGESTYKVYAPGELANQTVNQQFKQAYDATLSLPVCGATSFAAGWPGVAFSACMGLPQTNAEQVAPVSGVSGMFGTYQSFGDQSTTLGAIDASSKGVYAVFGNILKAWRDFTPTKPYSAGACGFPTSAVKQVGGVWQQDFEGGSIRLDGTVSCGTPTTFQLTVTKSGVGSGTVTSSPSGINCGSSCSADFTSGQSVMLMASAAAGSTFSGWSGACMGTSSCSVTVSSARNVTANFTATTRVIGLSGNLAFGNVQVNTTATRTLTIGNSGNAALAVSGISYPNGLSGTWSSGPIAAGASQEVEVTFAPTAQTSYNSTITVASDSTDGMNTIVVSGIGTAAPTNVVVVKPVDVRDYNGTYQGVLGTGSAEYSTLYRDNQDGGKVAGCEGEGCGGHPGVDIRVPSGTQVRAIHDGVVARSEDNTGGWGGLIVIKHTALPNAENGDPVWSIYAHLKARNFAVGATVRTGDVIGLSGGAPSDPNPGNSTGAHLHFQLDRDVCSGERKSFTSPYWPANAYLMCSSHDFRRSVNQKDVPAAVPSFTYSPMAFLASVGAPATAPTITTQPEHQAVASGHSATLRVVATGVGLSYQWYIGNSGVVTSPITGATSSSYTTPALAIGESYWVRVSNADGVVNSNTATIVVLPTPPTMTTQPQSQTIASGQTATLSVGATGPSNAPISYQWYAGTSGVTTSPIGGATSSSYTTPPLTNTTNYWVRVWNPGGGVNSNTATITVTSPTRVIRLSGNLAFGSVQVGTTATRTLTISNTGSAALTVTGITYPSGFSVNWSSGAIAAGGSQYVTVTFAPTAATSYSSTITVTSNKTDGTNTTAASGTGTAAATCTFLITPTSVNPAAAAGSQNVTITGTPSGCTGGNWTTSGNGSWLTVSPTSGSGPGTATVSWTQNTATSSHSGTATIANNVFTVTQGAAVTHDLTVTKSGAGSGTVTSSPGGINCGSACSAAFTSGQSVTLTASAASGSTFSGWSGACTGTSPCSVTMSSARNVTATFTTPTNPSAATRTLPGCYTPQTAVLVSLAIAPATTVQNYAVEDLPPTDWIITGVSTGGQWDMVNGKVKWGPYFDATARTVTYQAEPPAGQSGTVTFQGTVSFDGGNATTGGAPTLGLCAQHPADADADFRLAIGEMTAYGACWKTGCTTAAPPLPIPIDYATRAGYLWKRGEVYQRNAGACPLCWVEVTSTSTQAERPVFPWAAAVSGGTATSTLPTRYTPLSGVAVSIAVTPEASTQVYAVEDAPPSNWVVTAISDSGQWDSANGKVKWGPYFDGTIRTLTYTATPPSGETGTKVFTGTASFDGTNLAVGGSRTIAPQSGGATAPGAPTGVYGSPGNNQVNVSFTAPSSNGGSAITGYTVTASPGGITGTGTASPIVVTGLTNGTAYTFTVTATNSVGTSAASGVSAPVTPATLPGIPTGVSAAAGNGQVFVSFTAPGSDGGSAITGYEVTAAPGGAIGRGSVSPVVMTGLTNGSAYTFTVRASNVHGTGTFGSASTPVVPSAELGQQFSATLTGGQQVPAVSTTATGSGVVLLNPAETQITVSLSFAGLSSAVTAAHIHGAAAIGGNADVLFDFSGATPAATSGSISSQTFAITPAQVAELKAGQYYFNIHTGNFGSGEIRGQIGVTVPGAPTAVSGTRGNGQVSIGFTAPASNGGSAITGYTVTALPGFATTTGTSSPIVVSGLTNGVGHIFRVTASNIIGTGAASGFSSVVTPATVPDAPTGVTVTAGNAQASVAFTAPFSNGGSAITRYTVTASPGGATSTRTSSPIVVTGLTNGIAYTFTVTATNVIGTGGASSASPPVTPVAPTMTVDRASLAFGATNTGGTLSNITAAQTVTLTFGGASPSWMASTSTPWLRIKGAGGTPQLTVSVVSAADLPATGTTTGSIIITSDAVSNSPLTVAVNLTLYADSASGSPFGSFDTPVANATVAGSIAVTGWALDDIEVARVEIWRDRAAGETTPVYIGPGPGNGKIYIADPLFVAGARPDVETANPTVPFAYRAGWGYLLLTQGLFNQGNGQFTLYAFAFDKEGRSAVLGSKTITSSNATATKPFGSIDTPTYGQTVSGSLWNFGWTLTPNATPTCTINNGSVYMSIDSGALIPVTYGDLRADIAAAFPGFSNGAGAGGAYYLDTTTLTNGTHQIGWYVVDSCNRAEGVGSRFISVLNGGSTTVPATEAAPADAISMTRTVESADAIIARRGTEDTFVSPDPRGDRVVSVGQGERIEIQLPARAEPYVGYQSVNGERRALPLGSSLDAGQGTFYWQPAAGFLGAYDLEFVADGGAVRVRVIVGTSVQALIDTPAPGEVGSSFTIAGWAIDQAAKTGTGIDTVHVWAHPASGAPPTFLGVATYGDGRPDIGAIFGEQFTGASYSLPVNGLAPGTYDIVVYPRSSVAGDFRGAKVVRVAVRE